MQSVISSTLQVPLPSTSTTRKTSATSTAVSGRRSCVQAQVRELDQIDVARHIAIRLFDHLLCGHPPKEEAVGKFLHGGHLHELRLGHLAGGDVVICSCCCGSQNVPAFNSN